MRRLWVGLLVVGAVGVPVTVHGAAPAGACSCATPNDREAFAHSDAVFVGTVADYEPPAELVTSADPAVWTFAVREVHKGDVAERQEVVSEYSGASCGLEIPKRGEFLVFATARSGGSSPEPGDGQYYAGLCGGTRAVADGALEPGLAELTEPTAAPRGSPIGGGGETGSSRAVPLVVAISVLALGAGVGAVLLVRRRGSRP